MDETELNEMIVFLSDRFRGHLGHGGNMGTGADLTPEQRQALISFIDSEPDLYQVIFRAGFVGCASLMREAMT